MTETLSALALWNVGVFVVYAWDKAAARRAAWRIPERTLLTCALLAGCAGAWLAVLLLRHKSAKPSFLARLALVTILNVAAVAAALYLLAREGA